MNTDQKKQMIEETKVNPLDTEINREIFKNIFVIFVILMLLSMLRGSEKFPSIVGIEPCSLAFWALQFFSFCLVGLYAWRNIQILKGWYHDPP